MIGIADAISLTGFVISLFNSTPLRQEPQKYVEAPTVEKKPFVQREDIDYCKDVSAEQWNRVGQSLFDAFEGTKTKNEICKSLIRK